MANNNLCFTLAFNLVSETEKAVENLYRQNDRDDFKHYIVDCGFPLLIGNEIPSDIEEAKSINTAELKYLAERYGSQYFKIKNKGVSQNWQQVYDYLNPDDSDMMCCVEPDEEPIESGWIKALSDVLKADRSMGYCVPLLIDNKKFLEKSRYAQLEKVAGHDVYIMSGNINYGLLAVSGTLMNKMKGMPIPKITPIYGNIEGALLEGIRENKMRWGVLKNYTQVHTNVPMLYREWKNDLIFGKYKNEKQIPFEDWLILKRENKL